MKEISANLFSIIPAVVLILATVLVCFYLHSIIMENKLYLDINKEYEFYKSELNKMEKSKDLHFLNNSQFKILLTKIFLERKTFIALKDTSLINEGKSSTAVIRSLAHHDSSSLFNEITYLEKFKRCTLREIFNTFFTNVCIEPDSILIDRKPKFDISIYKGFTKKIFEFLKVKKYISTRIENVLKNIEWSDLNIPEPSNTIYLNDMFNKNTNVLLIKLENLKVKVIVIKKDISYDIADIMVHECDFSDFKHLESNFTEKLFVYLLLRSYSVPFLAKNHIRFV